MWLILKVVGSNSSSRWKYSTLNLSQKLFVWERLKMNAKRPGMVFFIKPKKDDPTRQYVRAEWPYYVLEEADRKRFKIKQQEMTKWTVRRNLLLTLEDQVRSLPPAIFLWRYINLLLKSRYLWRKRGRNLPFLKRMTKVFEFSKIYDLGIKIWARNRSLKTHVQTENPRIEFSLNVEKFKQSYFPKTFWQVWAKFEISICKCRRCFEMFCSIRKT